MEDPIKTEYDFLMERLAYNGKLQTAVKNEKLRFVIVTNPQQHNWVEESYFATATLTSVKKILISDIQTDSNLCQRRLKEIRDRTNGIVSAEQFTKKVRKSDV
jgi:hypothetical protein